MADQDSSVGRVKYGKDEKLEEEADRLLAESVGENKRSIDRDAEKLSYPAGRITLGELRHYDPRNDWDTLDSVFTIVVDPGDIESFEPTICTDVDEGNIRARNPALRKRKDLMRHVGDDDNWGSAREEIPLLGVNEGPRKVCSRCGRPESFLLFSPDDRNRDGLRSWCMACERESSKMRYTRKST